MFIRVSSEINPRKMWGRNNRRATRHALRYRQTAPPFQSKYKKSRNSPLRIGFIDLKKCYQIRMFKIFSNGRLADQVIAIKEVIKCIQKSMIYEPSFE
jgi:hypothetical protein